jgi:hypothetical protein
MVRRSFLSLVAAFAAALLHLNPPVEALSLNPMALEGRVIVERGNQMPGPLTPNQRPGAGATVVAIRGYLSPQQPGQPFLPANALRAPILARASGDSRGQFRLTLPPSKTAAGGNTKSGVGQRITLLLAVPGGYYLNRFDAQGRFASISLPISADQSPILIHDDRGAIF